MLLQLFALASLHPAGHNITMCISSLISPVPDPNNDPHVLLRASIVVGFLGGTRSGVGNEVDWCQRSVTINQSGMNREIFVTRRCWSRLSGGGLRF